MGRKAKLKQQRREQTKAPVVIVDEFTNQEHVFTPKQMKIVAEMLHRARQQEGQRAAMDFVEWIGTIKDIKGIGEKRARDITNHFLAHGIGGKK